MEAAMTMPGNAPPNGGQGNGAQSVEAAPAGARAHGGWRRWLSRPLLLTGTAVVAVAAGAGIAIAATSGSSTPLSASGSLSAATSTVPAGALRGCRRVVTPLRAG